MRQSPSSSRKRSTTRFVASGTTRVAVRWSSMKATRLAAAFSSSPDARLRARASAGVALASSAMKPPIAAPSSAGRPMPSPFQKGSRPGSPNAGRDQDPVVGDLLDAPARRPECEHVADPRLVDHLFVELADAAARPGLADHEHAEQPPVGNRAAARHREPLCAAPADDRARVAVPHEPGAQLAEPIGRVATGEQVERGIERRARQRRERRRAAHELEPVLDLPFVEGGGGDGLLREHVERVRGDAQRLDRAAEHALGDDGGVQHVGAVLREDDALRDLAHLVPGPADALQPAGDRWRRLDLHDEVDRPHVDAELEARRRDDAAEPARLEVGLDECALFFADRTVVRPRQHRQGAGGDARRAGQLGRRTPSGQQAAGRVA